jgi:hypothetical protein
MWFRSVLIILLVYFLARSLARILRPRETERRVKGAPAPKRGAIDENRIQDATFKDIPEK